MRKDTTGLVTTTVDFSIANAESLLSASPANVAFGNLGGPFPSVASSSAGTSYFDWGLPFYFGRNVFTSIEGQSTPVGTEFFIAF